MSKYDLNSISMIIQLMRLPRNGWRSAVRNLSSMKMSNAMYNICIVVYMNDGISQDGVAKALRMDKSSVAKIVSKAIEEGYISRIVDNQDRRKYQLKLTPKGTACVDDILGRLQAWQDEVLGKLDESERKHFLELLGQVYENAEALDR